MIILGIETSCDDTSISIVESGKKILSLLLSSQNHIHEKYWGIIPEVASRKHLETILPLLDEALKSANIGLDQLDAIAVTTHPGLIGSLLIGINTAKTLAYDLQIPLIPISHLKAHFYSLILSTDITYPFIGLLVSGGHTILAKCLSPTQYEVIGTTLDDACGECFDKIAKNFNIGYPGGPAIERIAKTGNDSFFNYPKVKLKENNNRFNFSYSGLKTAVIYHSEKYLTKKYKQKYQKSQNSFWESIEIKDLAASFQKAALDVLAKKTLMAAEEFDINSVGVCGGVSANQTLKKMFLAHPKVLSFFPDMKLCGDNAAMVAGLAYEYFRAKPSDYNIKNIFSVQASARSFKKNHIL